MADAREVRHALDSDLSLRTFDYANCLLSALTPGTVSYRDKSRVQLLHFSDRLVEFSGRLLRFRGEEFKRKNGAVAFQYFRDLRG